VLVMIEIVQGRQKQTHGEYALIFHWLGTPRRPDLGEILMDDQVTGAQHRFDISIFSNYFGEIEARAVEKLISWGGRRPNDVVQEAVIGFSRQLSVVSYRFSVIGYKRQSFRSGLRTELRRPVSFLLRIEN
jgi:hypothetical protein